MSKIIKFISIIIVIFLICVTCIYKQNSNPYDKEKEMYLLYKSKNFNIYCYTRENKKYLSKDFLKEISLDVEKQYNKLTDLLDIKFMDKVDIKIYESSDELKESIGLKSGNFEAMGYGGLGDVRIVFDIKSIVNKNFIPIINHELVHVITIKSNPKIEESLWLLEGVATYYSPGIKNEERKLIKEASAEDTLPKINEIISSSSNVVDEWGYMLYTSLIDYIVREYGEEKLVEIINNIGERNIFDTINNTESEFSDGWIKFIKSTY